MIKCHLLPLSPHSPLEATTRLGLQSLQADDFKAHSFGYVLPSDPQTGANSNVQLSGHSEIWNYIIMVIWDYIRKSYEIHVLDT